MNDITDIMGGNVRRLLLESLPGLKPLAQQNPGRPSLPGFCWHGAFQSAVASSGSAGSDLAERSFLGSG